MARERGKGSKGDAPVVRLVGDPNTEPEAARQVHQNAMAGAIYGNVIDKRLASIFEGMNLGQSALTYADDLLKRMAPRDPLEEMLVIQALVTHARVLNLTEIASRQDRLDNIRILNEYTDKATNTFRRLMLALGEYRKPPRSGDTFTAIRQANIAGQQVVVNGGQTPAENTTNEQGCERHATGSNTEQTDKGLPAQPGGARVAQGVSEADEALGAVNGSTDG